VFMTATRGGFARAISVVAIALMASACTVVTGGEARAPSSSRGRPLNGQEITQVLLGHDTLSRILQQPLIIDHRLPPRFGGREALQDVGSALPVACLGVAEMLHHSVYASGKVNAVAVENWRHASASAQLTGVKEGVVSLPTAADASALFSIFARQWQQCDGQTVRLPDKVFRLRADISSVQVAPSILAGTVSIAFDSPGEPRSSIPAGRAIGVRGNCLVEAEVDYFNVSSRSLQGSSVTNATAFDIVHLMMDRAGALS
jgi:PknH-like extracellular domain